MGNFFGRLFEGMDTPEGALFGVLSIGSSFFPFFNSFLKIFHAPAGWTPWAAGVLTTFICIFIKLLLQTFHKELSLDLTSVKLAAILFVSCLYFHTLPPPPPEYQIPQFPPDPFMSLFFYVGLFAAPTYAFTAMQFRRGSK